MKQSFDDELNNSFEKLKQNLHMKAEYHGKLRKSILLESKKTVEKKLSSKKIWLSVAATLLLLVGSSPLYSPTMASLAAKILPLQIPVGNSSTVDSLHSKIMEILEQSGYEASSVGTRPNPYTIEIVLMKGADSLVSMKKVLVPQLEQLLYDQGTDQYRLNITLFEGSEELPERHRKLGTLMDEVDVVISSAFLKYGYSDLAQHATYGIKEGFFSNVLEIDIPDHVKEAEAIQKFVIEAIDEDSLNIKEVKVHYYNAKHRSQDNRWAYIVSDIHAALAGKSIYNVTGISYKVKGGVTNVWIKTALPEYPDKQIISDIETALQTYLATKEIKETIQSDHYKIQLINEDETHLLQVSNIPGE